MRLRDLRPGAARDASRLLATDLRPPGTVPHPDPAVVAVAVIALMVDPPVVAPVPVAAGHPLPVTPVPDPAAVTLVLRITELTGDHLALRYHLRRLGRPRGRGSLPAQHRCAHQDRGSADHHETAHSVCHGCSS